jgi:4-hydroxy-3-methylbut-2-enyl diphosphate reductase
MISTIESKARPCPGVQHAIEMVEEVLRREEKLYLVGSMIHNQREIDRLCEMGLQQIDLNVLDDPRKRDKYINGRFLIRAHGEPEDVLKRIQDVGFDVLDTTCSIVRHSQELIDQHIREGWSIAIVGHKDHPEVIGLLARAKGSGVVISDINEASTIDLDERTLLLAQTTIDGQFFYDVGRLLSKRLSRLKIIDTTCRFLKTRQKDIQTFGKTKDVVILIGGKKSSNCRLLYQTSLNVNPRSYKVESPDEIDHKWFKDGEQIGITGGASTPRWQLEEMKSFLNNHHFDKNPKGLINKKGGRFLCWIRKKTNRKT